MSPITALQCDDSVFSFVISQSRSLIRQPKAPPAMTGRASAIVSGFIIVNAAAIPTVTCAFANIFLLVLSNSTNRILIHHDHHNYLLLDNYGVSTCFIWYCFYSWLYRNPIFSASTVTLYGNYTLFLHRFEQF